MPETYRRRHGVDWPADMSDQFIDLVVAKKWREYRDEYGHEFKDPWVPLLDTARTLVGDRLFKVSPWTEQHFHDFVMEDSVVTWGCASSGKGLLLDAPLYFPGRVGTMRDATVGSYVIAATGNPVEVTGVYDHVDLPLYRVVFDDGAEVVCDGNHLWSVRYWGRLGWTGPRKTRKGVYGWREEVWPVARLAGLGPGQIRRRRMSVPLSGPVAFADRPVPVDPYVLGCLLGDGAMTQTLTLSSHADDVALREEMQRRIDASCPGYRLALAGKSRTSYMLVGPPGCKRKNPFVAALKSLGLYGRTSEAKFVPEVYKVNSVDVRVDILAGLMDTDGSVDARGGISFCSVSETLANDVRFLLESLGASVTISRHASWCVLGGRRRRGKDAFRVQVRGLPHDVAARLFKLPRKRDRVKPVTRHVGRRSIVSVTPVEDRGQYPRETRCITIAPHDVKGVPTNGLFLTDRFVATHNSNDYAYLILLDWLVDPYDTVTLVGSTTKVDLRSRIWDSLEKYFAAVKSNAKFAVPGKMSKVGFALQNETDADNPESAGDKAGIQGRALEEGGRLQGAHARYVRLVVDELATIEKHQEIKTAMVNLRVGTKSFKFIGLANPESWTNPSCQYCIPEGGIASVDVDTGSWRSTFGAFVRHHDGFKSPCVVHPELRAEFPYLLSQSEIEQAVREADGNADAPQIWKMIRGFPTPTGDTAPTVLDPAVARQNHVMDPVEPGAAMSARVVAVAAGVDPAWTEGGDGACRARVRILVDDFGRCVLDFTGGLSYLKIQASDPRPPVQQMRDQVIAAMRVPGEASFHATAIDASANQGLAADLAIYAGADCLAVNNSVRASKEPIRRGDTAPADESVYDRGTESWVVLAEFCRAGQVRGLPAPALDALVKRRFATRAGASTATVPLRLEPKEAFKSRIFKKSPDEADACALAALAVKERLGLVPYGFLARPSPAALLDTAPARPAYSMPEDGDGFEDDGGDGGYESDG